MKRKANGQWANGSDHLIRHGMAKTPIYNLWSSMLNRCSNPNAKPYPDYGGRGITVCQRWQDFAAFYEDVGDRPDGMSLDRIDNDLGYFPANVRWADRATQNRNKRNNRTITIDGNVRLLEDVGLQHGLKRGAVWARISKGWDPLLAATTPPIPQSQRNLKGSQKPRAPKEQCKNGHEMTAENTYRCASLPGQRICLICKRATSKRFKERRAFGALHGVTWSDETREQAA